WACAPAGGWLHPPGNYLIDEPWAMVRVAGWRLTRCRQLLQVVRHVSGTDATHERCADETGGETRSDLTLCSTPKVSANNNNKTSQASIIQRQRHEFS